MPFTTDGLNKMIGALDGATTAITLHLGLHTANTPTSGNEVTGGSPAYARRPVTFGAASNGVRATSADVVFNVPAGATVASVAIWSASTGGTILGFLDTTDEVYGGQGVFTVNSGATVALTA